MLKGWAKKIWRRVRGKRALVVGAITRPCYHCYQAYITLTPKELQKACPCCGALMKISLGTFYAGE